MDPSPLGGFGRETGGVRWRRLAFSLAAAALLFFAVSRLFPGYLVATFGFGPPIVSQPLPEFTQTSADRWLNSPPLKVADLRGKVVFLDVWTFG